MTHSTAKPSGPLAGVRVLDLGGLGPGPFAGMVFADLGADLIRIQRPHEVDTLPNPVLDRGKRSIIVDMKSERGVDLIRRLARTADIVIEGFRPGVAERLGVGPAELQSEHPELVYGRITGYGQSGPYSHRAGHDLNYIATSGILDSLGRAGGPPLIPANLVGDFGGGGMLLLVGVLAALTEARATGVGRVVDAAMVEGSSLLWAMMYGFEARGTWGPGRGTNTLDSGAPYYDVYRTSDGHNMAVAALEPQFYAALVSTLGLAVRLSDGALSDKENRAHWPEIREVLTGEFAKRTRAELVELFSAVDACVTPVLSRAEAAVNEQNVSRSTHLVDEEGVVHPSPAPRFGSVDAGSGRVGYSRPTLPGRAVPAGTDTREVLTGIGLSHEEVEELDRAGVVVQRPAYAPTV
ncbi:CaiB/BaiF CoA-transferase family protein [Rhodococcus olei]|uniref:CaiB/BaiF CoA-transferase family protein n=1 Tax=Rhodococcus olei TaxID=2161675 RepID=A0ABP8NVA6_9NOCA